MNDEPAGPEDPQVRLAEVVAEANRPEPPRWVQGWQMVLAFLVFAAAFGLAFLLVAEGPPPPKTPEGTAETAQEAAVSPTPADPKQEAASVSSLIAEGEPSPPREEAPSGTAPGDSQEPENSNPPQSGQEGEPEDDSTEPSGSTGDSAEEDSDQSLASLNEEGPWAFAIIALLIGAFLATGKTLSFGGTSRNERQVQTGDPG